jgi:hypothetical protein
MRKHFNIFLKGVFPEEEHCYRMLPGEEKKFMEFE